MIQRLFGTQSFMRIQRQKRAYELLTRSGYPGSRRPFIFSDGDFLYNLLVILTEERRFPRHQHIGNDPNGPHIRFLEFPSVTMSSNFRWNIVNRPDEFTVNFVRSDPCSVTKVNHHNISVTRGSFKHDIFRLQVTMHNVFGVTVFHRLNECPQKSGGFLLCKVIQFPNAVEESSPGT